MPFPRRHAGLCGLLMLAAQPALAEDPTRPLAVTARVGLQVPADIFSMSFPELGPGPSVELAASHAFLPWLEIELAAGWSRSTAPRQSFLVRSEPNDLASPVVQVDLRPELTTAPLMASLRLVWPHLRAIRPYAVIGGGAVYGSYRLSTAIDRASGWAPEAHAGLGVATRVGAGLMLGAEGRWRWAHAELRHSQTTSTTGRGPGSLDADLGGMSLQATSAWTF